MILPVLLEPADKRADQFLLVRFVIVHDPLRGLKVLSHNAHFAEEEKVHTRTEKEPGHQRQDNQRLQTADLRLEGVKRRQIVGNRFDGFTGFRHTLFWRGLGGGRGICFQIQREQQRVDGRVPFAVFQRLIQQRLHEVEMVVDSNDVRLDPAQVAAGEGIPPGKFHR